MGRFSDVPKPEDYLHTYRDMNKEQHIRMLNQLMEGTQSFVAALMGDEDWASKLNVSAGFHYPVRPQYSTLYLQLRVNSGSVCREDARGIEVSTLVRQLQMDTRCYARDDRVLTYNVTENVKVSLLAAAKRYQEEEFPAARLLGDDADFLTVQPAEDTPQVWKQMGFDSFELGRCFGKGSRQQWGTRTRLLRKRTRMRKGSWPKRRRK